MEDRKIVSLHYCQFETKNNLPNNENFLYIYHYIWNGRCESNETNSIHQFVSWNGNSIIIYFHWWRRCLANCKLQIWDVCIVHYVHCAICTQFNYGIDCFNFCCKTFAVHNNSQFEKWIELRRFNFQAGRMCLVFGQFYIYICIYPSSDNIDSCEGIF